VAAQVATRLVAAGLPVYQLASAQRDLESVFREVNDMDVRARREAAEEAADAA